MRPLLLVPLFALVACSSSRVHERADVMDGLATGGAPGAAEQNRSIIHRATVQLERDEPEQGPAQAIALAKSHGGYAQQAMTQAVVVRIPAERFEGFLAAVPALGTVANKSVSADDVTDTHRDLKVRLDNVTRIRERYLELLQRAVTVEDTLKVEKELERITLEYETLKSRLEGLEGSIALSTVYLDFQRPVRPGPVGWVFYGLGKGLKWLFVWD
ncbi:DUF4349 domain-containing protein [Myxococcus llanfairpwllgwyngyllgogerychwyrndrobwllllantysiliogogogochensis]|uniref:DUF4349 domain-containing protein n=1 Tax=Myxococcus llanfairpwllgwyngyllgogerychwyrndrobwllllantysiliogogogochensis TaxID=2590453 RepID=A0A540WIE2_9BACT|nr:DUF4349 domain-containing protein [Myxococcus llanfairpwllgwyngyllgogerychwyrndrobwllllantysiliogogogochensis]NTX01988.1 DUF4349 domain-containing protein [Myxococcus sp. CA040A]TQF08790.1 DUF4349 domain-containing protein [Myxococcus llanfairpwllgwyngyllgogerychwyrndrobwllllantysiliogogogochensis]